MKEDTFSYTVTSGDRRTRIENNGYGLELSIMRNGWQSTGVRIDDKILEMLIECITEYKQEVMK